MTIYARLFRLLKASGHFSFFERFALDLCFSLIALVVARIFILRSTDTIIPLKGLMKPTLVIVVLISVLELITNAFTN